MSNKQNGVLAQAGEASPDLSTPNQPTTTPPHTMHGTCMKALKGGLGVRHVEGEDMDVRTDNRKDREQEGGTWQGHKEGWTQKSKTMILGIRRKTITKNGQTGKSEVKCEHSSGMSRKTANIKWAYWGGLQTESHWRAAPPRNKHGVCGSWYSPT